MSRRPRKVLHVLNSAGGGAAMSAVGLAGELAKKGIASCAVCHDIGSPQERRQVRDAFGGEVVFTRLFWWNRKNRMPLWRRPLAEAKQIWDTGWSLGSAARVAECAERWHVDLIHTNTILTPEGGLAAQRLGLPHVWHLRELLGPGKPFRLRREGRSFGQYMASHCSKLVANSQICAAQVRDWLPDGLLEVVPNGIDIGRFEPRTGVDASRPMVVAMVGSLTSRMKKHALFVEAAAAVDRSLPIEWRIYGHDPSHGGARNDDSYTAPLHERIARAGMTDRFVFAGFVADPAHIMSQIDLLVHPADNESFGRVAVEAMAAGLPVVGVRGGGVSEIVEHGVTGLLARPDDVQDLAACIEQLVRDPARRQTLGAAGRQRAEAQYSLTACAEGMLRVYEKAMEAPLGAAVVPAMRVAVAKEFSMPPVAVADGQNGTYPAEGFAHAISIRHPRKVMHVLNSAAGGSAMSAIELVEQLAREGIRSYAVCHDSSTTQEREQVRDALHGEVVFTRLYWWNRKNRMPLWRRPLAEAKQIWDTGWSLGSAARVAECAARWQVDLIHTNSILTPEGGLAARRLGLPHVWHLRELLGPGKPFRLQHEGPSFGQYMATHCSKLVANSEICAAQVRDWLPEGLLEVVTNGIDIGRFTPRTHISDSPRMVVAMVGSLTSRWKKHELFVDAAMAVDRGMPIEWRIYGHDPSQGDPNHSDRYSAQLHERIAQAGMTGRFAFPGYVADPAEIMSQIDLLVHPADHESFGRVAVEAMAAGLPVVGVRGGGVAEIVDHGVTGLLARADDARDLAACIEQLARDPKRRQALGAAGRLRAEARYSIAACTQGILRVYELAMTRSLSPSGQVTESVA